MASTRTKTSIVIATATRVTSMKSLFKIINLILILNIYHLTGCSKNQSCNLVHCEQSSSLQISLPRSPEPQSSKNDVLLLSTNPEITTANKLPQTSNNNHYNNSDTNTIRNNDNIRSTIDLIAKYGGTIKNKNVTLTRQHNPIKIRQNIIIKRGAKLIIEPGTELLFERKVGIIVYGILEILGLPQDRVKLGLLRSPQSSTINYRSQLYHNHNHNHHLTTATNGNKRTIRLIDGDLPSEGRVQILYKDRWHSLCTNSKNLTSADINVICNQLGYKDGAWYKWFPRRNLTTLVPQMMTNSFECSGSETSVSQCRWWNRIRTGGGICDFHSDIGIRCSETMSFGNYLSSINTNVEGVTNKRQFAQASDQYDYWRGIEFVQSEISHEFILDGQMKQKISKSIIKDVLISEAGLNNVGNATASIRVYGQPPRMDGIDIRDSVYGIMIEDADDAIAIQNIHLTNNLGYPLFINTSWGQVNLDRLHVHHNGGDGIRLVRHEKMIVGSHDFCKFANLGPTQSYPVILSHEQTFFSVGRDCCQEFVSNEHQLTVHFQVLRSTPNNLIPDADSNRRVTIPTGVQLGKEANLIIFDDYRDEYSFKLRVTNETRAQSIVSKSGRLKICYEPASYRTVLFTIAVVAQQDDQWTARSRDFEITNSVLDGNEGRGLWLGNHRSGLKILNTTVMNHDNHIGGIHVENGTGEVIIQDCRIMNNTGHGLYINLGGGYFHIDNSSITDNGFKGILVEYDKNPELVAFNHTFHLGYSLIARNGEHGLYIGNVCRSDAYWNISMNSFIRNMDDAIYFESCWPLSASNNRYDHDNNYDNLYQISSSSSLTAIKLTTNRLNTSDTAAIFHREYQELSISHNVFFQNFRRAIKMAPIFFLKAMIRHNMFREHQLACIHISNRDLNRNFYDLLEDKNQTAPVNVRIASNRFYHNQGRYVANIGVLEDNPRHALVFTKNTLEDNVINEPQSFGNLRPRSRVSAVVVVSSSNTKVIRNRFNNPKSAYEIGSHLDIHSKTINATANFWGPQLDATSIYKRIFDRKNRYNLAQIEFLQYLMSPEDLEFAQDLSFDRERDKISHFRNDNTLGGEVKGYEVLKADTYTVSDDIFIRSGGHLILQPGTMLKFHDGVGMMVQGRLDSIGLPNSHITFTSIIPSNRIPLRQPQTSTPTTIVQNSWIPPSAPVPSSVSSNEFDSSEPQWEIVTNLRSTAISNNTNFLPLITNVNYTNDGRLSHQVRQISKRDLSSGIISSQSNVRLSHTTMGRLEVQIDGSWGSVCDYEFDIDDAAVVCQQLGMILNREDWKLEKFQYSQNDHQQNSMLSSNVLMTNVRCDPTLDTDFTKCKAEFSTRGDFDGMCSSEVGFRCFPPSWSGVRLGMGAETSYLEHTTIQRAGLFDYATYVMKPALQIDLNHHVMSSLVVKSNSDSGMGIAWNNVIGRHFSELLLSDSKFLLNERHGIELKSKGLSIKRCSISSNRQNGLDYNPTFSAEQLDDLISWLDFPKHRENLVTLTFPFDNNSNNNNKSQQLHQHQQHFHVPSSEDSFRFFQFQRNPRPNINQSFVISTDLGHMLSIHLLKPIDADSTESLQMSTGFSIESPIWDLRLNTTAFPMVSPSYKFHFNYSTGKRPIGRMILYVRSRYNNRDLKLLARHIPNHLVHSKFEQTASNINSKLINLLNISQTNITKNGIGLRFRHSNYPYGVTHSQGRYNFRFANETTNIVDNYFDSNHFSSISVSSDDYEPQAEFSQGHLIPGAEIVYNINGNYLHKNRDGIRQFSRDLRQSHNIFHWSVKDNTFYANRGGGVNIVLPYYWRYDFNLSHSMDFNNNTFLRNNLFEFVVDGHFALLNLTSNSYRENKCKSGLILLAGMEKQMLISENLIEANTCNRIVDLNIQSHADKLGNLQALFEYNAIRANRRNHFNGSYGLTSMQRHSKIIAPLHPLAIDHTLSIRGVQLFNITRNLFNNPDLRYELVVAVLMDPEERPVLAMENFWGSTQIDEIRSRIFDFDDWNNFAVVDISPYLIQESFSASTTMVSPDYRDFRSILQQKQQQQQSNFLNQTLIGLKSVALGGRLMQSLVLPARREPYLVESDFTVMPNVSLIIEQGVILEFMPNVGILVLGELIASGSRDKPILMRPRLSAVDVYPLHDYLKPPKMHQQNLYKLQTNLNDPQSYDRTYTLQHYQLAYSLDLGSIRLCKNEICNDGQHIYENNVEDKQWRQEVFKNSNNTWKIDGFLEMFNMTTLQWVPVCDPLFTEHTARVVCRQLGYTHLTLFKRGRRYTIDQESLSSIRNWMEPVQCDGDELTLANCPLTPRGFTNHSSACTKEGNQFVYIYCQDFPDVSMTTTTASAQAANNAGVNLQQQHHSHLSLQHQHGYSNEHVHHWGGIQFSCPSVTGNSADVYNTGFNLNDPLNVNGNSKSKSGDSATTTTPVKFSRMRYVSIDRAGMSHRRKSPAVQILHCPVQLDFVAVTNSAHHGLDIISSQGQQNLHQIRVRNNLGVGLNYISLTGSSSSSRHVPYLPLKHLDMSTDIFGLVDICGANKEIQIGERLLLVYRYTSQPVDCIKIITSKLKIKHVGIRMLQFDLFNSTAYTTKPDSLKIFDGNIFDRDSRLLVDLGVTEKHRLDKPELKFYQTSDNTMSIIMHASGSSSYNGFVAEIVTTPVSYNIQRDTYNNMTFSEFINNKLGAMQVFSAGESTPNLIVKSNRFESNCMHLFGNFTSCTDPIYLELQNCQRLRISGNLIKNNQGGMMIKSYSHSAVSALDAAIEYNVFEANSNTNTLAILGPKSDPYQSARIIGNIFTRNQAPYLSNIVLSRMLTNFSSNIVSGNIGKHQIEVLGFDKLPLAYQAFEHNWIYNNSATFERDRSTIFGTSAGQVYRYNYMVNPDNSFEISTYNWTRYDVKPFQVARDEDIIHLTSGDGTSRDLFRKTVDAIPINIIDNKRVDLYHATIDAKSNWWGFDNQVAIQNRIRDRAQFEELIKVDYMPYLQSNKSLLNGICAGGWHKIGQSCLVYVGARMTYAEARDFCDKERATLPLLRGNHYEFSDFVRTQERDFVDKIDRIWIRSFDVSRDACPAMNDFRTKNYDCLDRNAFICERDPQVVITLMYWHHETGGLIALILALITSLMVLCCSFCWAYKSSERQRQKLQRKNSIHASMRSRNGLHNFARINSSANSLTESFLHRQIYNATNNMISANHNNDKTNSTNSDLSTLSTQLTQPTSHQSDQQQAAMFANNVVSGSRTKLIQLNPNYNNSQLTINSSRPMSQQSTSLDQQELSQVDGESISFSTQKAESNTNLKKKKSPKRSKQTSNKKSSYKNKMVDSSDQRDDMIDEINNDHSLYQGNYFKPRIDNNNYHHGNQSISSKSNYKPNIGSQSNIPSQEFLYSSNEEPVEFDEVASTSHYLDGFNLPRPIPSPPNLILPSPQASLSPSFDDSYSTEQVVLDPMPLPPPPPPLTYSKIDHQKAIELYYNQQQQQQQHQHQQRLEQNDIQIQHQQQPPDYLSHFNPATNIMLMADHNDQHRNQENHYSNDKNNYETNTLPAEIGQQFRDQSHQMMQYYNSNDSDLSSKTAPTNNTSNNITTAYSYNITTNTDAETKLLHNNNNETPQQQVQIQQQQITTNIYHKQEKQITNIASNDEMNYSQQGHHEHNQATYNQQNIYNSNLEQQYTNRYCVETSFDLDKPIMAPTGIFGGSQRLSPDSSTFDGPTDSKLGSRVYLETSFE